MVIFRPHRGGLAESLADAQTFDDIDAMKDYIVRKFSKLIPLFDGEYTLLFGIEDLVLNEDKPGIPDERCGWDDTRYVCVKRMGNEVYDYPQCIGMWATRFPVG